MPLFSMLQRYKQLLPVFLLVVCCLATIIAAVQSNIQVADQSMNFAIDAKHYGGLAAVASALLAFFRFRAFYKYILAVIFLLGLFHVIGFTPVDIYIGFGFGDAGLKLDVVTLAFALLAYALNKAKINAAVLASLKPSEEKMAIIQQEEIADFKDKFSRKSTDELAHIVTANTLVPSALTAARQLLKERQ